MQVRGVRAGIAGAADIADHVASHDALAVAHRNAGAALDLSWFPGEVIASRISGENRFVWAFGELVASKYKSKKIGVLSQSTILPQKLDDFAAFCLRRCHDLRRTAGMDAERLHQLGRGWLPGLPVGMTPADLLGADICMQLDECVRLPAESSGRADRIRRVQRIPALYELSVRTR